MKRTLVVLLAYTAMVAVSGAGVVMTDGFEAADTFAGNGWTSTDNWAISASTWGNPGHYVWGGGGETLDPNWDSGSIQKDTGYMLVPGDDQIVLTFDIRGMGASTLTDGELLATVYGGATSLGTVTYYDDDSLSPAIPTGWNGGLGSLTVNATAAVGENIIIKFEGIGGTSGTSAQRIGIDNVQVEVIPEPATLGLVAMVGTGLLFVRRRLMM